jgi:glycogen(starch) synthase
MRILYVSNYFPPHYVGGYELHCGQAAEWMARNGHEVRVLTGDFRRPDAAPEAERERLDVRRELALRYWTDIADLGYWAREWRDIRTFGRHLQDFRPDIVVLWNMTKLSSGIVLEAERLAPLCVYHLMDNGLLDFRTRNGLPQFWARAAQSFWGRLTKPVGRWIYRQCFASDVTAWSPRYAVCVSNALRELLASNGLVFKTSHVSWITYDVALFNDLPVGEASDVVRFFWAGRLCRGKGLATTLDAIERLFARCPDGWTVDFCGPIDPEDDDLFTPRLARAEWKDRVRYLGLLPPGEMPAQYAAHDAFLFTSEVHEGLPGTIVEAFASGMPVIGTQTGGTRDVLREGENCLVYPMGDSEALSQAMERMIADEALRDRIGKTAASFAYENFGNESVFPRLLAFYEQLLDGMPKKPLDDASGS